MNWKLDDARRCALVAISIAVVGASGCAQEREPISKVQADALQKEFFVGKLADPKDDPEFYWRNFVVDGSEAQSMVGIGSWSGIDRIRWEITQDKLLARKAYGIADGADDKGKQDGSFADGTIVAAYQILSHFDIRREYNPSTGEEYNVIVENTTDRPWYERDHMRVDWSMNLVETPMWNDMFAGKVYGDIKVTPIAYYVSDRAHPDAPHFEPKQGYFDITSKFFVEPAKTQSPFSDLTGKIPTCIVMGLYTGAAVENCDPQEAVIRSSYWRVDQLDRDGDFEPLENTKASLDIIGNPGGLGSSFNVGVVTPPRIEWDPQYGYTDQNMRAFMHHHDIWAQSHQTRGQCKADTDCQSEFGGGACLPSGSCSVSCDYEKRADLDANGSDDQCENSITGWAGAEGSQCSARNRCTIPYRDRELQTVGYWMNAETPLELTDPLDASGNPTGRGPTEDLIYSWNQLMKLSVAKAREVECRSTGAGDRQSCHELYFEPGQTEMVSYGAWDIEKLKPLEDQVLVACHNPVRSYDHPVCGKPGYSARIGDLRHNFLYYWPYASRAPWGGIANWNADPLTGQIIGASATTMGRSATYAAAMVRDIIMVANGELSMADITGGTPATLYEKELRDGHAPQAMTEAELQKRVASIDAKHAMQQVAPKLSSGGIAQQLDDFHAMLQKTKAGIGPASTSHLEFEAIAGKVRGSKLEAQLVDPSWALDAAGMSPETTNLSDVMEVVSPLRGMDQGKMQLLEQLVDLRMQARGICFSDIWSGNVGNMDVQGVAKFFADKYSSDALRASFPELAEADEATLSLKRADLIYTELWKETYKGIQLHEVGHSLGMLHQFASSFDSANFLPQYWQLRSQEGAATASCNGKPRSGDTFDHKQDSCMGPRYLDPETDDELGRAGESRPGLHYYGHTSTMEYQNERFFETVGLGQFDLLTMNALYGRVLQTFDPDRRTIAEPVSPGSGLPLEQQLPFATRHMTQLSELNLVNYADDLGKKLGVSGAWTHSMHYTEQARRMQVFDPARCREATAEERAHAQWRIVHGKVCSPAPKDYAFWHQFEDGVPTGAPGWATSVKWRASESAGSAAGNVRWPYRWGVTSNSYAHTNPGDAGADIYEVTRETIRKFDYSYPFSYFRRQNRDWYYRAVPARTSRAFFDRLRAFHWSMAVNNGRFQGFGDAAFDLIAQSDDWWRPYIVAETEMFSAIAKSLLSPQIGRYSPLAKSVDSTRQLWDADTGTGVPSAFEIDASTGRFIDPDFDSNPTGGGSWQYQSWVNHTGFTVEKADAAKALTDGRAVLFTISRDNYLDGRNVNVNFRTDMPEAMDRLLGGLLASDWESIAPYVMGNDGPKPSVRTLDLSGVAPERPSGSLLLFPNVGYKQQLGALVWAHVFARLNTDLTLANKMRLWIDGMLGEVKVPEAQQVRFYDPGTGYTYIARKYGPQTIDGKVVDKGIASRMIAHANALLVASYEVERGADNQPLLDPFGTPKLVLDGEGNPVQIGSLATLNELRGYIGLLDSSVQVQNMVGYGPFDGLPSNFD
jgi:hypothetical protein